MKPLIWHWLLAVCMFCLLDVSLRPVCAQASEAQPPQPNRQAKKKDRTAKSKADDAPQWVWKHPQTPAGTQFKTFKSATLQGQEVSYLFWAPPGYNPQDQAKRYPVAYFLHGGGGNYLHIPEAFLPQAATAIEAGTLPPFLGIVVNGLPSSFFVDSQDGRTPVESILMKDLLPHVDATYPTNGVRLIEGFSMGGRGASYLAFKYAAKFRGLANFAGAIHDWDFFSRMQVVAQLFPDEKTFAEAWPFNLVRRNAAAVQVSFPAGVLLVVGDRDTSRGNTYQWNVRLHETLDGLKIPNELCVVKDVRHSYQLLATDAEVARKHLEYYAAVFQSQPPADRPAPSSVRGSQYPLLHADGTVTFRVNAREAKQIQIVPRGTGNGLGDMPLELHQETTGIWTATATVRPGFHYYQLRVDGFAGNDPASQTFFGWAQETSGLEVPDPALDFYTLKEVPHGDVRICTYQTRTTSGPRRVYVYTPPGYDEQPTRRYPVLYLQHGAGESERAWTEQGKANVILDNLIASARAEPMLVVMDNGYTAPPNQPPAAPQPMQPDQFAELVVNDLVPFIDGRFRTITSREQRAIAGLSMGGGQAMRIGLSHLETFAWIGTFSGAIRDFSIESSYGGALRDASVANRQLRLLWIGCGTEDRLIQGGREIHDLLTKHKVEHIWFEGAGSHEWQVWRKHLYDFAPRLFRNQ